MKIVRIKSICKKAGIAKLDGGPKGAIISFYKDKFSHPEGLVDFLSKQKGTAKLRSDNRLVIQRDWRTPEDKIKGSLLIAKQLANLIMAKA